jgi:ADP-ribosylglycohydrolase
MLGAIAGDIIGSVYESRNIKTMDFSLFDPRCRFTDDTVLSVAVADALLHDKPYGETFRSYYHRYPRAGYGALFRRWALAHDARPYNSWGNGSAMRVCPVGYAHASLKGVLDEALKSAVVTHNHPEGIKGAQAVAAAVFLARTHAAKDAIGAYITAQFGYDLSQSIDDIRPWYGFDVSCRGSVPVAIRAFLESQDYEDAVRRVISVGGDSDTLACITGGIAEAFYGRLPEEIRQKSIALLDEDLRMTVDEFIGRYGLAGG